MPLYDVPIVRKDLLFLWREFWDGPEPTQRARAANIGGCLEQAVQIRAENAIEAASLAESYNPGNVALHEYIRKLQQ